MAPAAGRKLGSFQHPSRRGLFTALKGSLVGSARHQVPACEPGARGLRAPPGVHLRFAAARACRPALQVWADKARRAESAAPRGVAGVSRGRRPDDFPCPSFPSAFSSPGLAPGQTDCVTEPIPRARVYGVRMRGRPSGPRASTPRLRRRAGGASGAEDPLRSGAPCGPLLSGICLPERKAWVVMPKVGRPPCKPA